MTLTGHSVRKVRDWSPPDFHWRSFSLSSLYATLHESDRKEIGSCLLCERWREEVHPLCILSYPFEAQRPSQGSRSLEICLLAKSRDHSWKLAMWHEDDLVLMRSMLQDGQIRSFKGLRLSGHPLLIHLRIRCAWGSPARFGPGGFISIMIFFTVFIRPNLVRALPFRFLPTIG